MIVILKTFSVFNLGVETWIRVVDDLNGRHQQLYQEKRLPRKKTWPVEGKRERIKDVKKGEKNERSSDIH